MADTKTLLEPFGLLGKVSFNDFETHAAVVVGAFPESSVIVFEVDVAFGIAAPIPFTVFPVDEVVLDVLPAVQSMLQGFGVAKVLVDVEEADYGFGLYPPVTVSIDVASVKVCFVGHRAIGVEAFLACLGDKTDDGFDFLEHLLVAQDEGSLVHEPGAFDVMTIAFEPTCTSCPIHVEEEVEVMSLGIEYLVAKDVDELTQRLFDTKGNIPPAFLSSEWTRTTLHQFGAFLHQTEEVGIGFDDVEVGILRLRIVGIEVRETHVGYRLPFACAGFDITTILWIPTMLLDAVVETDGVVEGLGVARGTCIFGETVNDEANGIELLLGVEGIAFGIKTPVSSTIYLVDEVFEDIVLGTRSSHQIVRLAEYAIGGRKTPKDACIQDAPFVGFGHQGAITTHLAIEASLATVLHPIEPERQDVVFNDILHFGLDLSNLGHDYFLIGYL